jgi:hypothetical protein
LDGEEPVPVFHVFDHHRDPVGSLPFQCTASSTGFSKGFMTLC